MDYFKVMKNAEDLKLNQQTILTVKKQKSKS